MANDKFPMTNKKNKRKRGFTLIEALTLLFVFSVITLAFYNTLALGIRFITISKNRLGAIAVANEKMEIVRNLSYADVGIVNGACEGNIPQDEDIIENGKNYHVHTLAAYVDDSTDGMLGGSPNDVNYEDYKLVKIIVSWNNGGADSGSVSIISRFVPPGLEGAVDPDKGILSINIFSDLEGSLAVPQASVHISNSEVGFDETRQSDNSGNVMIIGLEESIKKYQITVTKSGYETVNTLPAFPDSEFNPVDVHASVVAGQLNITNIAQNKSSNLRILTKDYSGNSVANINFDLKGGRKMGTEAVSPFNDIYNLNEVNSQTDDTGIKDFESISPGQYWFNLNVGELQYALIGVSLASPFYLLPDSNLSFEAKVADKNMSSLSVSVLNNFDNSPISGAIVKLSNTEIGYDVTQTTGEDGMVFFPESESPALQAETYTLEIEAAGFNDYSSNESIELNELKQEVILMTEPS